MGICKFWKNGSFGRYIIIENISYNDNNIQEEPQIFKETPQRPERYAIYY